MAEPIPTCPTCGSPATRSSTRYGDRDGCDPCGLWSWGGKPLVSGDVHRPRMLCHEVFDRLWKDAPAAYDIAEAPGTPERAKAEKRIRRAARNRAYAFIADRLGIPEPDAHMAQQTDIEILRRIYAAAKAATPAEIRDWWHSRERAA